MPQKASFILQELDQFVFIGNIFFVWKISLSYPMVVFLLYPAAGEMLLERQGKSLTLLQDSDLLLNDIAKLHLNYLPRLSQYLRIIWGGRHLEDHLFPSPPPPHQAAQSS